MAKIASQEGLLLILKAYISWDVSLGVVEFVHKLGVLLADLGLVDQLHRVGIRPIKQSVALLTCHLLVGLQRGLKLNFGPSLGLRGPGFGSRTLRRTECTSVVSIMMGCQQGVGPSLHVVKGHRGAFRLYAGGLPQLTICHASFVQISNGQFTETLLRFKGGLFGTRH